MGRFIALLLVLVNLCGLTPKPCWLREGSLLGFASSLIWMNP
ncbi:hypothetical protein LINPERHAP2_LOCUS35773 [Linum perenne]